MLCAGGQAITLRARLLSAFASGCFNSHPSLLRTPGASAPAPAPRRDEPFARERALRLRGLVQQAEVAQRVRARQVLARVRLLGAAIGTLQALDAGSLADSLGRG